MLTLLTTVYYTDAMCLGNKLETQMFTTKCKRCDLCPLGLLIIQFRLVYSGRYNIAFKTVIIIIELTLFIT
jgi:hypothetical protein